MTCRPSDLFEYESEAMMLYAVTHLTDRKGNTTVTLFGTGLPEQGTVRFERIWRVITRGWVDRS